MSKKKKIDKKRDKTVKSINNNIRSSVRKLNPILKNIVGKAGYSWIEDTTTFHRGTVPRIGDRLMLSLSFNDKQSAAHVYDEGYHPFN